MTREQIFKEVQKRLEELENTVDSPSDELLFFRKFVAENSFQNVECLVKADRADALQAYLLSCKKLDYKKIDKAITRILPLLDFGFENSNIKETLNMLMNFWKEKRKAIMESSAETVYPLSSGKNTTQTEKLVTLVLENNPEFSHCHDAFMAYFDFLDLYFEDLFLIPQTKESVNRSLKILLNGINFAISLNDIREAHELIHEDLENMIAEEGSKYKKKEIAYYKRKAQKILDGLISRNKIKEVYDVIYSHYQSLEKELSMQARKRNKDAQRYREFLSSFAGIGTSETINSYRGNIMKIPDESLRKEVLAYIYKYNLEVQRRTEEEYQDIIPNENSAYYAVLKKYGILQTSEVYAKLHSKYQQETLSKSLESLRSLGITDSDILYQILLVSNEKTILTLSELAKKEIFPVEVLRESPAVFNPNTAWYKSAMQNIHTIVEAGINPRYLSRNKDVLFASNEVVRENIAALKESKLITSINKDTDISFIGQSDTNKRVALVSATNNTSSVAEDMNLLNYDFWHWGRVYIMQSLSLPVPKEKLRSTLESKNFFIPDFKIESYIFDESLKPGKGKVLEKELKSETASAKN